MMFGWIIHWIETKLPRRLNLFSFTLFAWRLWGCISPINIELLELSRRNYSKKNLKIAFESWSYNNQYQGQFKSDHWYPFLFKPIQLARCIKRYHSAGNWFLLYTLTINSLIFYVWVKALFHQFKTGKDEKLAQYYATHYFPRLFESYPEPYTYYPTLLAVTTYYFLERVIMTIHIIKKSVLNRNGYKQIESAQLNAMFITALNWEIKEWCRFMKAARSHRTLVTKDASDRYGQEARCSHLEVPNELLDNHENKNNYYIKYGINSIDFSKCYEFHGLDWKRKDPNTHYIFEPYCRIDLEELSYMVYLISVGIPILIVFPGFLLVTAFIYELIVLLPEIEEITFWNCLAQLPVFLTDPNRIIRLIDICVFLIAQDPLQQQALAVSLDIRGLISRARKVGDLLQENLDFCTEMARNYESTKLLESLDKCDEKVVTKSDRLQHTTISIHGSTGSVLDQILKGYSKTDRDKHFDNVTKAQRNILCRKLDLNLRLARAVKQELIEAKRSYSTYLNIVIATSGIYTAVAFASSFMVSNGITRFLLYATLYAGTVPLFTLMPLCITIERVVSNIIDISGTGSAPSPRANTID